MRAAGFVLAGGQSRRMGRDKALVPLGNRPLVEHAADLVIAVTGSCTVIGDPARYAHLDYPCLADLRPGFGPLSGLETLLSAHQAGRNLVLACDMPYVSRAHLEKLLDTAGDCVLTQDEVGRLHPLCAVYDVACLAGVQSALNAGRYKLLDLVAELGPVAVRYHGVLANINTLEDLAAAER